MDEVCPGTTRAEFDAARAKEIKTAIENGDYEIDSGAVADAMLRLDRLLGLDDADHHTG